jgi:UDP-glucose 4-epimerase
MTLPSPILVTGASGFVGSALVGRLAAAGCHVVCLARSSSRIPASATGPAVDWIRTDRHDPATLRALLGDVAPAIVFNLAAYGVRPEDRDASAMIDGNVGLLANLLAAVADHPPRRFIHIGSCSEYGPAPEGARLSESSSLDPTSLYGAAKAGATLFGRNLAQRLEIPFVTLRLFGVYGPGEASYRLIPYLIDRLRQDQRVDLTPGEQQRDLTFIDDVVDALVSAAQSSGIEDFQSYNVCSGTPVRIRDIATSVCRAVGKPVELLAFGARPYRPDEPMSIIGNPARFHAATGWSPGVTLEEGIGRMVQRLNAV